MTTHNTIPVSRIPKSTRLTPYIMSLKRAKEYSISDVRRCLNAQPGQITPTECRRICKHARLRELTKNPLRTLQSYKKEMQICLRHGNREAHYVEGMKQYFALRHTRIGMRHFKISARKHFDQGNYLLGLLKLVSGDHNEGMKILDIFAWKKKTRTVDRLWMQLKQSLREIQIIKLKSYGTNQILLMPSQTCNPSELNKRCTKCFHYKEIEKFLQLVYRG